MKVVWNNEECLLKSGNVDLLLQEITARLASRNEVIQSIQINDEFSDTDWEEAVSREFPTIRTLKIDTIAVQKLIDETLLSLQEYTKRAGIAVGDLANKFYSLPDDETWSTFKDLLAGLEWLMGATVSIGRVRSRSEFVSFHERSSQMLKSILEHLENNDYTAIADILRYEVASMLEEFHQSVSAIIDNEVVRHDLN